jgi:chain length determinant protein EpsF
VAITFAVWIALAIILSFAIPDHYKAMATVVPNLKTSNPVDQSALPNSVAPSYEGTQIDIIESHRVIQKVIDRLQLSKRQELVEDWRDSFFYRPDNFDAWAADWLSRKLTVEPPRDSSVLEIKFSTRDPQFSVDLANAFADAYVEANLELNVEPAKDSAQWFQDLMKPVRANLQAAQSQLSSFQQSHGIVATDDRIDIENTQLTELEGQLVTAQGLRADSFSRQSHNSATASDDLPEVLQNPLIAQLKGEISHDQALLDDMRGRLGTNHPQYVSMEAQLASLQQREAAEVARVVGSIFSNNRVSVGREAELVAAITTQKAHVLQLKAEHDQAAMLQRDVEAAQRAYDLVTQRLAQTTLESQLQQTNVAILSRATLPFKRSWPVLWIDLLVGIFLGGMMGVGLALLREHFDVRLNSVEQFSQLARVPTFTLDISRARAANDGASTWARAKKLLPLTRRIGEQ